MKKHVKGDNYYVFNSTLLERKDWLSTGERGGAGGDWGEQFSQVHNILKLWLVNKLNNTV